VRHRDAAALSSAVGCSGTCWVEHALTNRLCGHVAELPPSLTGRNVEGTSRVGDDRRPTGRERPPERPTLVRSFFHNSAMTLLVSRDATGSHQVRRESFQNGFSTHLTALCIVPRTRAKGTTTQAINGLAVAITKRQRHLVDVYASTTHQPFQGGGAGSNPDGGPRWPIPRWVDRFLWQCNLVLD
jgi:hypothetical protein